MKHNKANLPQGIYYEHLETINDVRFTPREIDVIACLLGGRATKTIAHFLSIEEKTVETHKYNIMRKLECNSKESIIDFIEKSDKFSVVKKHYLRLLIQATFEKWLQEILTLAGKNPPVCSIIYWREEDKKAPLIDRLEKHLKIAGIKILTEIRENHKSLNHLIHNIESQPVDYLVYALPKTLMVQLGRDDSKWKLEAFPFIQKSSKNPGSVIFLLRDRDTTADDLPQEIQDAGYVDFGAQENYYFAVLDILKKVFPNINLEPILLAFRKHYEVIYGSAEKAPPQLWSEVNDLFQKENSPKSILSNPLQNLRSRLFVGGAILLVIFCALFFMLKGNKSPSTIQLNKIQEFPLVRSDLPLPQSSAFLERSNLIAQIDEKFKGQRDIQTVALTGIGGSGKTILARQYAHSQKSPIISEINAETKASLIDSFEHLASAISQTEEDKNVLDSLKNIETPKEREEKVIELVKKILKLRPNWFLIYDNVEQFADVQKYFPVDQETWGQGKVIVTTRDSTIQNNSYISSVIHVGELNPEEMLSLFIKIMDHGDAGYFSGTQREQAKKFLGHIPPFPLDVSIAAYYLKVTGVPYEKYLEHLGESSKDFEDTQEKILKESSNYDKTRYSIIALSIKQLIDTHKDFQSLLLLVSLLDSQNIPRDLLDMYKKDVTVDNFIYHLKRYSLITAESPGSFPILSVHRNLQDISLIYLIKRLDLKNRNQIIQNISDVLENYISEIIDTNNFSKMNILLTNCEVFLSHQSLLTDIINIGSKLGRIYSELGYYEKAEYILNESLTNLNKFDSDSKNHLRVAWVLAHLGNVHRKLGDYEKSRNFLEDSLAIYKKHFPENHDEIANVLSYLGNLYRCMGQYKESKDLFEQSFAIYKERLPENHHKIAWILACLGNVNRNLGHYGEASALLEQSLSISQKYFPENHTTIAWVSTHLGIAYTGLGNYEKARLFLAQGLDIYKKYFLENHINIAWVLEYLGVAYGELGDYEKARNLLEQSLVTHETVYGKDHIETARVLRNLGQVYILKRLEKTAEDLINKALKIFQQNNHPESYTCLESLAELNLKKYESSQEEEKIHYKNKAVDYLKKALEIVEIHFPKDSPHIENIKSRVKKIEMEAS